ncbi:MAG: BlaI/MecI/CopY family transcriptional regulator [Acidobacteriota bacterium]
MKFSFKPSSKGVAQVLGELESAVIEQVWRNPDCTAREVLNRLTGQRQLAYTTVVTVLDRLHKKGFLKRRLDGRAFLYSPGITETEFHKSVTRDVLEGLLKEGSRPTLSTFVDLVAADEDLLKELEELIKQKRP